VKGILVNIFLFQKPLLINAGVISIILGFIVGGEFKSIGILFFFMILIMHFLNYEIRHKQEYYYYYNLGLSKLTLWVSTLFIGLISLIISVIL